MNKILIFVGLLWCFVFATSTKAQIIYANYVEWSPVGNYLAVSTGFDASVYSITIYDADTMETINQLVVSSPIKTIKWNRVGTQIAFATFDREIIIWNEPLNRQDTFELQNVYEGEIEPFFPPIAFAWSPDNGQLAGITGGVILTWNVSTGDFTQVIDGDFGELNSIAWSNNTNKIGLGSRSSKMFILNGDSWEVEKEFYFTPDTIQGFGAIDFNSSGTQIVASRDRDVIYVWAFTEAPNGVSFDDLDNARIISEYKSFDSYIGAIDWSPNDLIVASSDVDGTLEIHDVNSGQLLQTINVGDFGDEIPVSWSPDGTRLAYISQSNFVPTVIVPDIDSSYLMPVTPVSPTSTPNP